MADELNAKVIKTSGVKTDCNKLLRSSLNCRSAERCSHLGVWEQRPSDQEPRQITVSVKLPVELLQCNLCSCPLSFCQVHKWIWVRRKYDATVIPQFYIVKSRILSGLLYLPNGVVQLDQGFIQYFIWQLFSLFTILTILQAAVLAWGDGRTTRKETVSQSDHKRRASGETVSTLIWGIWFFDHVLRNAANV